jgi:hypothetical protein
MDKGKRSKIRLYFPKIKFFIADKKYLIPPAVTDFMKFFKAFCYTGWRNVASEIIPIEPDPDNAGEGILAGTLRIHQRLRIITGVFYGRLFPP